MNPPLPTQAQVDEWLLNLSNWGRWGKDDQKGAVNLITPEKRVEAARLVRSGRIVSLARPLATAPAPENRQPVEHRLKYFYIGHFGVAVDYIGIHFHGIANTHLDALSHCWGAKGLFNARDPEKELDSKGARWGGVEAWGDGIVTRGVLLDIPKLRGKPFVEHAEPVHGWDLEAALHAQRVELQPGDAVCVYSGREAWAAKHGQGWGAAAPQGDVPGLHASCLKFFRDHDVAVLVWDMMDMMPSGYSLPVPVHGAIFAYGMAFVDNALLEPLAAACAQEGRYEFNFSVAPLKLIGGTGGPINPLAQF